MKEAEKKTIFKCYPKHETETNVKFVRRDENNTENKQAETEDYGIIMQVQCVIRKCEGKDPYKDISYGIKTPNVDKLWWANERQIIEPKSTS